MKKFILGVILAFPALPFISFAQNTLPEITVKNLNGRVVVSWLNNYTKPLENIIIQRSFDSLGNFKSIGSVLNPQNLENGYPDQNPPYDKMYYRVFIYFENGDYISGPAFKAVSENNKYKLVDYTDIPEMTDEQSSVSQIPDSSSLNTEIDMNMNADKISKIETSKENPKNTTNSNIITKTTQIKKPTEYSFPSTRVFCSKFNNLIIRLPEFLTKKYLIKFFDDSNNFIFEIKKITEDYLILEKSNFFHSGWFYFEIFEDGLLIEKNKFLIGKDVRTSK